jgi:putative membrane protein
VQWWCVAQDVAWTWSWRAYPGVWLFVGAIVLLYARLWRAAPVGEQAATATTGESPLAPEPFSRRARTLFAGTGIALLWIALDWPVGALGAGYLVSVHTVQFLLISLLASPLLLLGIPRWRIERWLRRRAVRRVAPILTHPLVTMAVFVVVMAFTHWSPVVDTLMASQAGTFGLDMLWLAAGLVFWWPVAVALPERAWLGEPFKIGYLVAITVLDTGLFAYLAFSELPLYATFELAPPIGLLTVREDQLLAGLIMKIGGGVIYWIVISMLFFRWFRRSETEDAESRATAARTASAGPAGALSLVALLMAGCADAPRTDETTSAGVRVAASVIAEPVTDEQAALYLRVENAGESTDTLDAVAIEGVRTISMHHTETVDGMMRMRPVDGGIEVPPGGSLRMRPGGTHVMLEGLARAWTAGDRVPITVRLRHTGALVDTARVVALADLEREFEG